LDNKSPGLSCFTLFTLYTDYRWHRISAQTCSGAGLRKL